ncbi:MAG: hypothetical protein NT169_15380 [Chloroflexi bacterium]|nr:hypothetical protein [Chloroflexota bacterium]
MPKKRSPGRRPAPVQSTPARVAATGPRPIVAMPRWRRTLLLLTLLPMLAGILLFAGAWGDVIVLGSATAQTVTGALLALLGFAASSVLQGRWLVGGGWALLGVAIALVIGLNSLSWAVNLGMALGVAGLLMVATAFMQQFQAQTAKRR